MLFNWSTSKLLVYNKNVADQHFEINGTDVSTCEKTIHLGNILSTTDKYEMVFDGINKIKNKKLFHQYCSAQYDLNYGHCGMTMLTRCAYSGVMLCVRHGSYHMVRTEI